MSPHHTARLAVCARAGPHDGGHPGRAGKKAEAPGKDSERAQVFCTTMLGNFEVMSRARSAIWIATRRAIAR